MNISRLLGLKFGFNTDLEVVKIYSRFSSNIGIEVNLKVSFEISFEIIITSSGVS